MSKKTILIVAAIAGVIYFVHSINPKLDDHKASISQDISATSKIWTDLQYNDYYIASATRSKSKMSMVTYGLCKYVKVVDDKWVTTVKVTEPEDDSWQYED